jgi:hypothetical protein
MKIKIVLLLSFLICSTNSFSMEHLEKDEMIAMISPLIYKIQNNKGLTEPNREVLRMIIATVISNTDETLKDLVSETAQILADRVTSLKGISSSLDESNPLFSRITEPTLDQIVAEDLAIILLNELRELLLVLQQGPSISKSDPEFSHLFKAGGQDRPSFDTGGLAFEQDNVGTDNSRVLFKKRHKARKDKNFPSGESRVSSEQDGGGQ